MRTVTIALLLLLGTVHYQLWLGDGGMQEVRRLQAQLTDKQRANAALREANRRLVAEVEDLRQGLEMVEERARADLGMVKTDEILVQYANKR